MADIAVVITVGTAQPLPASGHEIVNSQLQVSTLRKQIQVIIFCEVQKHNINCINMLEHGNS